MNSRRIRIALNILLTILFLVGIAGMFVPRWLHTHAGCILMLALLGHIWLNRGFFKSIVRGRPGTRRLLNSASIIVFGAAMLLILLSGLHLIGVIDLPGAESGRALHMGAAVTAAVMLLIHLRLHLGRYVRSRKGIAGVIALLLLAVVGMVGLSYADRWYRTVHVVRREILPGAHVSLPGRVLTVYFSRVGNTDFPPDVDAVSGASVMREGDTLLGNAEVLALMAQDAAGGDLLAIRTEKTYPAAYAATTQEARMEFAEEEFPRLREYALSPADYDTIILVFPLWWDKTPRAAASFLRPYDLSGKTILPIVTHGGGGPGKAADTLKTYTNADVREILAVYSSNVPSARRGITDYLRTYGKENPQ